MHIIWFLYTPSLYLRTQIPRKSPQSPAWWWLIAQVVTFMWHLCAEDQWSLMVQELWGFTSLLGYSELSFRCDNEPTLLQLQRYDQCTFVDGFANSQSSATTILPFKWTCGECSVVGRIRCWNVDVLHDWTSWKRLSIKQSLVVMGFETCKLVTRFGPLKGMSPYEVIKTKNSLCRFGGPIFGFSKVEGKGTARWSRMIFLGKLEPLFHTLFHLLCCVTFPFAAWHCHC